ncbi:MAG TPA: efflux RND transporter periplasmic adaptor subunit, partial [Terriglobales bacterium]|nr:efflux RND transporter periplasmic adaptor subunit [Terriglobales bacterium]
ALTIPAESLLTAQDGTTSVMVAGSDGRAHQKDVKVGIREKDLIQVTEGLSLSERIVGAGAFGLPDNSKITAQEKSANQSEKE